MLWYSDKSLLEVWRIMSQTNVLTKHIYEKFDFENSLKKWIKLQWGVILLFSNVLSSCNFLLYVDWYFCLGHNFHRFKPILRKFEFFFFVTRSYERYGQILSYKFIFLMLEVGQNLLCTEFYQNRFTHLSCNTLHKRWAEIPKTFLNFRDLKQDISIKKINIDFLSIVTKLILYICEK